jgi:hypothetical protein
MAFSHREETCEAGGQKGFGEGLFNEKRARYVSPPEIEGTPRFPLEVSTENFCLITRLYTSVEKGRGAASSSLLLQAMANPLH